MKTPTNKQIESVLSRIDAGDVVKTPASYAEGIRVGIMWATGKLETADPLN